MAPVYTDTLFPLIVKESVERTTIMKAKAMCVALLVGGFIGGLAFFHYSYMPDRRIARIVAYSFFAYMIAVPVVLLFLKNERYWRIATFAIWLVFVLFFAHVMISMD